MEARNGIWERGTISRVHGETAKAFDSFMVTLGMAKPQPLKFHFIEIRHADTGSSYPANSPSNSSRI